MPIYEYQCTNCHHLFERIQKVNEEPIRLCPQCSQYTAQRWVSAPGFQLKGTGWYATDFKDKKRAAPTTSDASKAPVEGASAKANDSDSKSVAKSSDQD